MGSQSALETFVIQYKEPEIKENKSFKLAFGRDMILQVYMDIEWNDIIDRRNRLAINTNAKINEKRIPHKYKVGDKIFIILKDISEYGAKLNKRKEGPYKIVKVYKNVLFESREVAIVKPYLLIVSNPFLSAQ